MKSILICALCSTLIGADFTIAQEEKPGTPAYVYAISAGATLVIGGLWAYRNFVKAPSPPSHKTLKQQALDELKYFGTEAEKKALKKLKTTDEIHNFMAAFWKKRDPSLGTEENEAQEEFYLRRDYANAHFGKEGWKTDRGRAHILYGPPDEIQRQPMIDLQFSNMDGPSIKAMEIWIYLRPASGNQPENVFSNFYSGAAKFAFADFTGTGRYTQIYSSEAGEISDPRIYVTGLSLRPN